MDYLDYIDDAQQSPTTQSDSSQQRAAWQTPQLLIRPIAEAQNDYQGDRSDGLLVTYS